MQFTWDPTKAAKNLKSTRCRLKKRRLCSTIHIYVDFFDPDHSEDEERYLIVGKSIEGQLLIVSYTEKRNAIRIITARKVTRSERETYEEG